jgi:hypothetical protein
LQQGHLEAVQLPGGGRGYQVRAEGVQGSQARSALREAGFSYRKKVGGADVWMNQVSWQKMQRQ